MNQLHEIEEAITRHVYEDALDSLDNLITKLIKLEDDVEELYEEERLEDGIQ